ncbi:MAG: apolipoprotein N-acyltransferase, partial [Limnohabitans sp.]
MKPLPSLPSPAGGLVLAAVAGASQALSIAWPGTGQALGWLQILGLALLASGLCGLLSPAIPLRAAVAAAARRSGVFALFWLAGTFWWLHVSMHQVGGMPAPLSAAAVLLLAGALGLDYVAAASAWVALVRLARWSQRPLAASVLFAALWLLAELLRGRWFTGVPWGAGGYAHLDGWIAAAAPWVGVYGMGALAAWLAMRLALLRTVPQRRLRAGLGMALLLGGVQA